MYKYKNWVKKKKKIFLIILGLFLYLKSSCQFQRDRVLTKTITSVAELSARPVRRSSDPGPEDPWVENGNPILYSCPKILWTEEPGGL